MTNTSLHAAVSYTSDGVTTAFTIPFNYLDRDDLSVFVDGEDASDSTTGYTFSFTDSTNLSITKTDSSAIDTGKTIKIQRKTNADSAVVEYQDGAVIRAQELNANTDQLLFALQEVLDRDSDRLGTDTADNFDANDKRIVNVGDPVDAGDAINKGTFDTASATILQAQRASASSAQAASESAGAAAQVLADVTAVQASIEAAYRGFGDRYLGEQDRDPQPDEGEDFEDGTLYYNTTLDAMRVFGEGHWRNVVTAPQALITEYYFVATEGQTDFTGADRGGITLAFSVPRAQVYINGVRMSNRDFSMTTDTVTLAVPATAGDLIHITAYSSFAPANVVPAAGGGTFLGAVAFDDGLHIGDWKISAGSRYLQFFYKDELKAQLTDTGVLRLGRLSEELGTFGVGALDPTETK